MTLNKHFILCGFKAVGKSYYSRLLSSTLRIPLIETDHLLENFYLNEFRIKRNCYEIYSIEKEIFFRSLEKKVISTLPSQLPSIIALGGGALLDQVNQNILKEIGHLVYLEDHFEIMKKRIALTSSYLNAEKNLHEVFLNRHEIFKKNCSFKITLTYKSQFNVLKELIDLYSKL